MSPQVREQIRKGCNLAELPADVLLQLDAERARTGERYVSIGRHAERIRGIGEGRIKAEIELGKLGDLEPLVRKRLNRLMGLGK